MLICAVAYLIIAGLIQFCLVSAPLDADMDYHVAVGRLIREHGILHDFPWTPFSWLAAHYADKELLYHLLFVPLAGLNWIIAAKIVATLLGAAMLFTLYLVLSTERVRFAWLWAFLPLVTVDAFLWRFALGRPLLISISLTILVLWAASRERLWLLAIVSAIFPWVYVAWFLPLVLVCVVEACRCLSGERIRRKPLAVSGAGLAAGLVLHPNSANLLHLTWIQIVDVLFRNSWGDKAGIELGQEFLPFTAAQWARWFLACAAMTLAGLVLAWRRRKEESLSLCFAVAALLFGLLTVKSARFEEYYVPLSVAALGLASGSVKWRYFPAAVALATLLYSAIPLSETIHGLGTRVETIPPSLAAWLRQQVPRGSEVFTTDWGHTGTLMLALPDRKFIVALDPTFFYENDPELYSVWYRLPREAPADAVEMIRQRFKACYVLSYWDPRFSQFYKRLSSDPGVRTLLVSDWWMLFDLGGGNTANPNNK